MRTKALILAKKLRASLEQSQACCPTKHKKKVSRLAIRKQTKTSEQGLAVTYIVLHVDYFYSHTLT